MKLTPSDSKNTLLPIDVQQIESLLISEYLDEYKDNDFKSMRYRILAHNRCLLEYTITFFDDELTQFYRDAIKVENSWILDNSPLIVTYRDSNPNVSLENVDVNRRVQNYINRKL